MGFYIPGDVILHSHRRENLKSYMQVCVFLCVDSGLATDWYPAYNEFYRLCLELKNRTGGPRSNKNGGRNINEIAWNTKNYVMDEFNVLKSNIVV
jgi:hypothetical protein